MRPNNSAAYDFSLFEPKKPGEDIIPEQIPHPPKRKKKAAGVLTSASVRPAQAVRWSAAGLLCLLALTAIILCDVQITSLSDQISKKQSQLTSAQAEEVRLNMQLQSRVSLDKVETYATAQLGMQKAGAYQVNYIHITNKDKVVLGQDKQNLFARLYDWVLAYL